MNRGADRQVSFALLQRALGLSRWQAMGVIEALLHLTAENAPDGGIGKLTDEEIAAGIEWPNEPERLVGALLESGLIERSQERRLALVDWTSVAPEWIKKRHRRVKMGAMGADGRQVAPGGAAPSLPSVLPPCIPPLNSPSHPKERELSSPTPSLTFPAENAVGNNLAHINIAPNAVGRSLKLLETGTYAEWLEGRRTQQRPSSASTTPAERYIAATTPECEACWAVIPLSRQRNINRFRDAWAAAVERGANPRKIIAVVARYYESPEGRSRYARAPATIIDQEIWLEDESAWIDRDKIDPAPQINPATGRAM